MLPFWTAAVDPRVLAARSPLIGGETLALSSGKRIVRATFGNDIHHVVVEHDGRHIRMDIRMLDAASGQSRLRFMVMDDDRLPAQLDALRLWRGKGGSRSVGPKMDRQLIALLAVDAHAAGHSLRSAAELLFSAGDWPGDGECRKSRIRRLIARGRDLIRAGPRPILAGDWR